MEEKKKPGRPKSGIRPTKSLKAYTNLSSGDLRILVEKGLELFLAVKTLIAKTNDEKTLEILDNNPDLVEVLDKWEGDLEYEK